MVREGTCAPRVNTHSITWTPYQQHIFSRFFRPRLSRESLTRGTRAQVSSSLSADHNRRRSRRTRENRASLPSGANRRHWLPNPQAKSEIGPSWSSCLVPTWHRVPARGQPDMGKMPMPLLPLRLDAFFLENNRLKTQGPRDAAKILTISRGEKKQGIAGKRERFLSWGECCGENSCYSLSPFYYADTAGRLHFFSGGRHGTFSSRTRESTKTAERGPCWRLPLRDLSVLCGGLFSENMRATLRQPSQRLSFRRRMNRTSCMTAMSAAAK